MFYNRGDLIIGTFIPSHVGKIDYSQNEVTVTCASWKKSDGSPPDDEVNIIKGMVAHGYDNSNVIQAGTVMQSFNPDDIVLVTDGFESFLGVVADVVDPHDQHRDEVIVYQIKIARYLPPKEPTDAESLPDGDEDTWDDDWELGYEKYGTSGSGGGNVCSISDNEMSTMTYTAGSSYDEVAVYSYEEIAGVPWQMGYGYLIPGQSKHILPYNLKGYTVTIQLDKPYTQAILSCGYGGVGKPVIGEFGEVTYEPVVNMMGARLWINNSHFVVPFNAGEDINSINIQAIAVNLNSDHIVMFVECEDFPVFNVQKNPPYRPRSYSRRMHWKSY